LRLGLLVGAEAKNELIVRCLSSDLRFMLHSIARTNVAASNRVVALEPATYEVPKSVKRLHFIAL
jgi:hypothetical protein